MSVFDTSAAPAVLYAEAGADVAKRALGDGVMSIVNVAEALGDLQASGLTALQAQTAMQTLGLTYVQPDEDQAIRAAAIRPIKGLSLGDRFCIALAQARNEPLLTSDQAWRSAPIGVTLEMIR